MKKTLIFTMIMALLLFSSCGPKSNKIDAPTEKISYISGVKSIIIEAKEGIEYSIDNGEKWLSGDEVVFDKLNPNTDYKVLYRFKKNDTQKASESAEENIKTKALSVEGEELDKVLVIGNQNSMNILDEFYSIVLENNLVSNLIIGYLIKEDESLNKYSSNMTKRNYKYEKNKNDGKVLEENFSVYDAIVDESWDLIIIEQTNEFGGILKEYKPSLSNIVNFIANNALNVNVEIAFQMPWAYEKNSEHLGFKNYRNDQIRMYNSIISRINDSVINNEKIKTLIPTGTALQNLRTTVIGEEITLEDGETLNNVGKITASLMWIKKLYRQKLDELKLDSIDLDSETLGAIIESINNAFDKPLEITRSVNYSNPYKDKLYMLSIGNSFTQDAYVYLAQMLIDIGIKDFVIGYLYAGGASLNLHLNRIKDDTTYDQYRIWNNSTTPTTVSNQTIKGALKDFEWDIVTIQQASSDSGIPLSFRNTLTPLLKEIKNNNPNDANTKYGYHMTWAYTDHWEFGRYNNDQIYMYEKIVETTQDMVVPHENISFIIPAGTAIQNLRKSMNKDEVTRDGYHLNGLGQYIVGLMWVKVLTNIDLKVIKYQPIGVNVNANIGLIQRAVDNAYNKPYEIS